jgi:hypothetical protein
MDKIRKIIREEVYKVVNEIGEEDPMKLSQSMVDSNEEQVKELERELKYTEADARVGGLPREEKKAREERVKVVKDRLELAKKELEMAKQAEINAVKYQQMQSDIESQQDSGQSQISPQV